MVSPTPHQTNPRVASRSRDDRRSSRARADDASDPQPDASRIAREIERRFCVYTLAAIARYRPDRLSALPTLTDPQKDPLRLPKYKRRI